jgi:hypothetical protein
MQRTLTSQSKEKPAMNKEQRQKAALNIQVTQKSLQEIGAGTYPGVPTLERRRQCADWQLCYMLRDFIPTLPHDLRAQVQACYDAREHQWSSAYAETYYAEQGAQEKARSGCLATTNEPFLNL